MMRSLFSGVAGLKTHQTKMDVIGNNIANVNTVGFKSSSVTFSDVLYQTTQSASGANDATGMAGVNAKQIGLGSKVNSITTATGTGGTQTTDSALDCMINGNAYFIVNSGGRNLFTKAGSFFVDAAGTLCTASGAKVQGWQVNSAGTDIERDTVSNLEVMGPGFKTASPEPTTNAYLTGNIDSSDPQLESDSANGATAAVNFYDSLGKSYTLKLAFRSPAASEGETETSTAGQYEVTVTDCWDSSGKSIFFNEDGTATSATITFGGVTYKAAETSGDTTSEDGSSTNTTKSKVTTESTDKVKLTFNTATGKFVSVVGTGTDTSAADADSSTSKQDTITFLVSDPSRQSASDETQTGEDGTTKSATSPFEVVNLNFSSLTQFASNGKSSMESQRGSVDGTGEGAGRPMGAMSGLSIDQSGKLYGSYDNGTTRLLGQIAVTTFANATGLEAVGNSYFAESQNSGEFDGIGKDITETGGSLTTGALEMSNVDLAAEFTSMITTQRGFQANSRIITTSDTLLEELINLKR